MFNIFRKNKTSIAEVGLSIDNAMVLAVISKALVERYLKRRLNDNDVYLIDSIGYSKDGGKTFILRTGKDDWWQFSYLGIDYVPICDRFNVLKNNQITESKKGIYDFESELLYLNNQSNLNERDKSHKEDVVRAVEHFKELLSLAESSSIESFFKQIDEIGVVRKSKDFV